MVLNRKLLELKMSLSEMLAGKGEWLEAGSEGVTPASLGRDYLRFMGEATRSYHLVTGDVPKEPFEGDVVILTLAAILEHEGGSVEIIFQDPNDSLSDSFEQDSLRADLMALHPKLWLLGKANPASLHVYRSKSILSQHYAIVDGIHIMFQERDHARAGARYAYKRYNDRRLARQWMEHFEALRKKSVQIMFDGTLPN